MTAISTFCNDITFLCVTLSAGSGASYTDADPSDSSNVMCINIAFRLTCAPGLFSLYLKIDVLFLLIVSRFGEISDMYANQD